MALLNLLTKNEDSPVAQVPLPSQELRAKTALLLKIIDWENGDLSEAETLWLFQELVNTGLAWESRAAVRQTASLMLFDGRIKRSAGIPSSLEFKSQSS